MRVWGLGLRVSGSRFSVQSFGCRVKGVPPMRQDPHLIAVQGSVFSVQVSGSRVQGSGFRVQGAGFRVQGAGFRVQ